MPPGLSMVKGEVEPLPIPPPWQRGGCKTPLFTKEGGWGEFLKNHPPGIKAPEEILQQLDFRRPVYLAGGR